jgi:hypothetical protein
MAHSIWRHRDVAWKKQDAHKDLRSEENGPAIRSEDGFTIMQEALTTRRAIADGWTLGLSQEKLQRLAERNLELALQPGLDPRIMSQLTCNIINMARQVQEQEKRDQRIPNITERVVTHDHSDFFVQLQRYLEGHPAAKAEVVEQLRAKLKEAQEQALLPAPEQPPEGAAQTGNGHKANGKNGVNGNGKHGKPEG